MSRRALLLALLVGAVASLAPGARAQTPFVPAEPYWLGPGTTNGVVVDATFQNFLIDSDGDGLLEPGEASHPVPLAFQQTVANSQYRLSPTREHLVLFGQAVNGPCTGLRSYYVYRIPPTSGDPLQLAGPPICVDTSEALVGFFDPAAFDENDTFFVVETSDVAQQQQIWWKRLADGTTGAGDFPFDRSVGEITFAPSGIAAFVQYDVDGLDALDSYQMVELCADDFSAHVAPAQGSVIDVTGGGVATATLLNATDVAVTRASDQVQIASYVLDACGATVATGACCLPDGVCSPGMTEDGCIDAGGTWQGADVDCVGVDCPPPPAVEWSLSASGPSQVTAPGSITWTFDVTNVGDLDAGGATITALLPSSVDFEDASDEGTHDAVNRRVIWSLGTVAAGSSRQLTLTVGVDCDVDQVQLTQYFARSTAPVTLAFGAPVVTTAVSTGGGGVLGVLVRSVSDTGSPPDDGDTVTHTIDLVETDGVARTRARFGIGIGAVWAFDTLVDDAGGTVDTQFSRFEWEGNVAPNDTTRIVFRTRLPDCRRSFQTQDALNGGFDLTVIDGCNAAIGTGAADTVVFAPLPVRASATVRGTGPTVEGFFGPTALARKGSPLEFEATVQNGTADTQDTVALSFTVPTGLVAASDPPWIGTPPAGATWDASTETASWTGSLGAFATTSFRLALDYPADGPCRFPLNARYGYGACADAGGESVQILGVEPALTDPHVVSVTEFQGLWSYRPGVDTEQQVFLCPNYEIQTGIAAGVNGDVWVAGTPTFRFNPITLDLEFFDGAFFADRLDMFTASDVAVDPNRGVVVFGGRLRRFEPISTPRVAAWDPATDQVTVLLDETDPRTHFQVRGLDVLDDGRVAITTVAGLTIVDPSSPAPAPLWTDPSWSSPQGAGDVAVRSDGSVLVVETNALTTDPKGLVAFDPDTGVPTRVLDDLLDVFPFGLVTYALDVDANDQPWLSSGTPVLLQGDPNAQLLDQALGGQGTDVDLIWLPGSTTTAVGDGDPFTPAPRAMALHAPVPNPFNPRTTIAFDLPRDGAVTLALFDARGRRVRTLIEGARPAGTHRVLWDGLDDDGRAVSSGVYFVRLDGDAGERFVRKAVLLR